MPAPRPAPAAQVDRPRRSPLVFIFLTVFIDLLGFGIVIPLLPVYSKAYGASELELGLLFSCFSGMQFLFAPLWGRLSDRIGRKPVLVGGLIGTALSYVAFAHANSMATLYLTRLAAGIFGANISSAQAYIADVTSEKDRAKSMGLIGAAFGLGFTFGPLLGGVLSTQAIGSTTLPPLPGYVAAALSLSAALFGLFALREPERHVTGVRLFDFAQIRHAASDGRIGILLALNFVNVFAFSCFESMFTRFGLAVFPGAFDQPASIEAATVDDVLRAAPIAGYYMFGVGVMAAVVQGGLIRRLLPRYGETRLAIVGPAILGLSLAIIGGAPVWSMVIVGCLLMPFGFGLSSPSVNGLLSRAAPVHAQGAYLGLGQSIASLARVTGPPLAGVLFAIRPGLPFFGAALVLFGGALLAARYRTRYGATFESARS